jgi:radical SAM superfamily enzyme YgiQ (UPF0313 family)
MNKVVLTSDRTLMHSSLEEGFGYSSITSPNLLPSWVLKFAFSSTNPQTSRRYIAKGQPTEAPYGLRKIEAKLLGDGLDACTVDPDYIEDFIEGAAVLGIYTMDPFGLGFVPATLETTLRTEEPYPTRHLEAIFKHLELQKAKRKGLRVLVEGPGAWQFEYEKQFIDEYGIDCVIDGEAEKVIVDFVRRAVRGEKIPKFHKVMPKEIPAIEEIPEIRNPSTNGLIEIGRGCAMGCKFCSETLKPLRWYPLEKIEKELQINCKSGLRSGILQAEDVLLYGSNTFVPNRERVLKLHEMAGKYLTIISWTTVFMSSIALNPKLIKDVSQIILCGDQKWWNTRVDLEIGSPRLLESLWASKIKPYTPNEWPEVLRTALGVMKDNKLFPTCILILNLPEETDEDNLRTIELIEEMKCFPSLIVPYVFAPITRAPWSKLENLNDLKLEILTKCYEHDLRWSKELLNMYFGDKMAGWFFEDVFSSNVPSGEIGSLEKPIQELGKFLDRKEDDESKYQKLIMKYPWVLGAQYESIEDHRKFDDENIPDFTGVRVRDKSRDIIEIKQPFAPIFRKDGDFTSRFNNSWNQVERYLNFAREEKDYLDRKGLHFENPKCCFIIGFEVSKEGLRKIRAKEKLNPAIEVVTYADLMVYTRKTVEFFKNLKTKT